MASITMNGVTYETFEDKNIIGTKHIDEICEYSGKIPDYVTSIGELWRCKNITIPNSVTSIGELSHCENITIPNSVTSIAALNSCSNITIPNSVTSIAALNSCSNITIPNSVTSIKFIYRCTLTIPASVATITEISGENGSLMLSIKRSTPPTLAKAVNLAKDDMLIVPEGAAEAYKKHPVWGKFKNISEDPSLNEEVAPASKGSTDSNKGNAGPNKEIAELKKEIAELRKDIANILKAHKELREDFEELKKKD